MSSSPTAPSSTTGSSSSSPLKRWLRASLRGSQLAPQENRAASRSAPPIACGALAQPAAEIVERRGWPVAVHPLPPLLHNQPQLIAGEVRALALELAATYDDVAVAYADCGTYGALDAVCAELGLRRLPGLHCYDLFAGESRLAAFLDEQPGTYLLTDFLVRSFDRTVIRELGLDRHPELRDDYFRHYTRVVWLAQEPDDDLRALAEAAAARIGPAAHRRRDRRTAGSRPPSRSCSRRCRERPGPARVTNRPGHWHAVMPQPVLERLAASGWRPVRPDSDLGGQLLQQVPAPGLGGGDLVEGEDVQALDEHLGGGRGLGRTFSRNRSPVKPPGRPAGRRCPCAWPGTGSTRRRRSWSPSTAAWSGRPARGCRAAAAS